MPLTEPPPGILGEEELSKISREELNEDPKRVKQVRLYAGIKWFSQFSWENNGSSFQDIKAIQDWIKKQPHLHKYCRTGKGLFKKTLFPK